MSFHWLPHCCFPTENSLRTENDHRKWFESSFTVWHAMSDDHPEPSPAYLQFHAVFSRNRAPIVARFVLVSLLRLSVRLGEHYKEGRASAERVLVDETAATLVQICKPCEHFHVGHFHVSSLMQSHVVSCSLSCKQFRSSESVWPGRKRCMEANG